MGAVLVGADHTEEGQAAIHAGIEEALRRDAELVLAHHVRVGADDQVLVRRQQGEALLARAEALAEDGGVPHRRVLEVGSQSAASVLLDLAATEDVEVIVIGTRRRSRVGKALMGGDAQQVIIAAPCQVLCVKADQEADHGETSSRR